uniref:Bm174 n=1 Tax=Brugia malayi TaxID=6279 RepID=A0A1I9GCG3_BRUMA|nr:Bm174 [Brugia malayi]
MIVWLGGNGKHKCQNSSSSIPTTPFLLYKSTSPNPFSSYSAKKKKPSVTESWFEKVSSAKFLTFIESEMNLELVVMDIT